jgi:predicted DNA repair protein MutK
MEDILGIAIAIAVAGIILYLGVYGATALLAVYDEIAQWLSRKKR